MWVIRRDIVQSIITNLDLNIMTLKAAKTYFEAYGVKVKGNTKERFIKELGRLLVEQENNLDNQ